jgi:energy-coupling factor transporter ATP-binding protein EcfA2
MARKYKCPYCEERHIRKELITHIDKEHDELIPEGYYPAQIVYDLVNNTKGHGKCRVCGNPTGWNAKAGRYDVLCNNVKCKEHMREEYKKNMLKAYGTYNILNDDEQQKKMLANRKISGKYKFVTDGGIVTYTGSYEKKFLEFIDKFMQIPSKDILAPGPTIEYEMNGDKHFYITDFLYIPYNLIIEIKDGGDNKNTKDTPGMRSSRERTIEKERLITSQGKYNYIRLTNNQFAQLIEVFMDIKQALLEGNDDKVVKINESTDIISETLLKNTKDIYYNKDKFDSGEINLCFITGQSGSGKSTMANKMAGGNIEVYELDDVIWNKMKFTMENFKEYGDLIYSFFKGRGDEYFCTAEECKGVTFNDRNYEKELITAFVDYAIKYSKSHKDTKFVIEGVWLYMFIQPEYLKDYAVYIKGTSAMVSMIRRAKRDSKDAKSYFGKIKGFCKNIATFKIWRNYFIGEENIEKYRTYFSSLMQNSELVNESTYIIKESAELGASTNYIKHNIPLEEITDKHIQNAFNSIIHLIKWCRMESYEFTCIKEFNEPKVIGSNEFIVGYITYGNCANKILQVVNDNNLFSNGRFEAKLVHDPKIGLLCLVITIVELYYFETPQQESCKDLATARKFVSDVGKLAKKYDANYFIVTDGASGTRNNGNPAVRNARLAQEKWERENGFDPDEDWSKPIKETFDFDKTMNDIIQFNQDISCMKNSMMAKSGKPVDNNANYAKLYNLLTPKEFIKYNGGACWDYVAYEAYYFKMNFPNIKFKTFCAVFDRVGEFQTHAFLLFYMNNKCYWFEANWKPYVGIFEFSNENKALYFIMKLLENDFDSAVRAAYLYKYNALDANTYGMNMIEILDYILKSTACKSHKGINNKPPRVIYKANIPYNMLIKESSDSALYHVVPIGDGCTKDLGYINWSIESYSKDLETAIINDIFNKYAVKEQDKIDALVYTIIPLNSKPTYLGAITIYKRNDKFDWEWVGQETYPTYLVNNLKNDPINKITDISNFYLDD